MDTSLAGGNVFRLRPLSCVGHPSPEVIKPPTASGGQVPARRCRDGSGRQPWNGGMGKTPRAGGKPRESTVARADYRDWQDRAAAELERVHGVKASTIPERVWKKLYVQNMTPQEAAEQAAVSAYTTRPAADRPKRR
jgi:hypothetical protein